MTTIELALEPYEKKYKSPYEWFINQEWIPFDLSYTLHQTLYQQFLQELYLKTNSEYFWFTQKGKLMGDAGLDVISSNSIKLNKQKLRDIKLEQLLNIN